MPGNLPANLTPQLVETAVESVISLLRSRFNQELLAVRLAYADGTTINLPDLSPDRYYISEIVEPLQLPAIFVIAERSEHNLDEAQNFELTDHMLLVVILIEDFEITRLTRSVWRMGVAAYRVLHDRVFNNVITWVEAYDYSPTYGRREEGGVRNFRKDVTIRVRARMYEAF